MDSVRRNVRALAFGVVAVVLGSSALVAIVQLLGAYEALLTELKRPEDQVMVVVAARDLHQGVVVEEGDLYAVQIPPRYLPEGVFLSPEHVVGRIPKERILANELVRGDRLASPEAGLGLHAVIPRGLRAISVEVTDGAALSGFLQPESYVDVLVTRSVEREGRGSIVRTETVLQAAFVLGVNGRGIGGAKREDARGHSVTLMVTPADAERVAHAENTGTLVLTLRPTTDTAGGPLEGADVSSILPKSEPEVVRTIVRPVKPRCDALKVIHGAESVEHQVQADGTPCE